MSKKENYDKKFLNENSFKDKAIIMAIINRLYLLCCKYYFAIIYFRLNIQRMECSIFNFSIS